ncbi:MAG: thioredoxin [Ruminococcaceae bacterium]|nr:thioredoxin [Oscillospiraceae bacterium]
MAEINVSIENFEEEILNSDIPVLVDFWAPWCGPCMMLAPVMAELAEENSESLKVCKINVDEESELCSSFGIASIPTVLAFGNGQIIGQSVGLATKEKLLSLVF